MSSAIVLSSIVPFYAFIATFKKNVSTMPLHRLERVEVTMLSYWDECQERWVHADAEARAERERILETLWSSDYEADCHWARHRARVEATEDICWEVLAERMDQLRFDALVKRVGLDRACRIHRTDPMWNMEEEECPIQRAERRAEFVMDSRMSGTPIDWDTYSTI
jgi:hypothetical protein